jgi:hypothetical protein
VSPALQCVSTTIAWRPREQPIAPAAGASFDGRFRTTTFHGRIFEFGADAAAVLGAYPTAAHDSPNDALGQAVTDAEYACGAKRLAEDEARTST